jgi:hypothetical protein
MDTLIALVRTGGEVATLFGICTPLGVGLGPFATKTPLFRDFSAGEAAAWGGSWGLVAAIFFCLTLRPGVLG